MTKACTKCGRTKPLTEFGRDRSRTSGYTHRCKPCVKAARRTRNKTGTGGYLPVEPLRETFAHEVRERAMWLWSNTGTHHLPLRLAEAELFGVDPSVVSLWSTGRQKRLQLSTAERIADHLGTHPVLIWGDAYYGDNLEVAS